MKFSKTLIAQAIAASVLAASAFSSAYAGVGADAGVANMYYWRGFDLGHGDASVSADLKYSESGFSAGIWGGSGDTGNGTEVDLWAGYAGGEADGFNYDITAWTYFYPDDKSKTIKDPGKISEILIGIGYGPIKYTYYANVAGGSNPYDDSGYNYMTLVGTYGAFSATLGMHKDLDTLTQDEDGNEVYGDPIHLDLSYAYNDRIKFTIGKIVENDDVFKNKDTTKFVASYTLPIEK